MIAILQPSLFYYRSSPPTSSALIPVMTSNTSPSGIASSTAIEFPAFEAAWMAFDNNNSTIWGTSAWPGWLMYQFPSAKTATSYSTTCNGGATLSSWVLEATNNTSGTWTLLDSESLVNPNGTWTFSNSTPYLYYRLTISYQNNTDFLTINSFQLYGY